jgi:uncharacterized protein YndB with AHSA1/START domain
MTEPTQTISLTFDLPHPPAKVWRALTDPALVASWLMNTTIRAELGADFTFTTQPTPWWNGVVQCQILDIEVNKRLRYTRGAAPVDTIVTWTLTQTATGTRLHLEQSGFTTDNTQAYHGAQHGWVRKVSDLEKVLTP